MRGVRGMRGVRYNIMTQGDKILKQFGGSLVSALQAAFPNIGLKESRFKTITSMQKITKVKSKTKTKPLKLSIFSLSSIFRSILAQMEKVTSEDINAHKVCLSSSSPLASPYLLCPPLLSSSSLFPSFPSPSTLTFKSFRIEHLC